MAGSVLDLTTGEVIEANAGHENPALCRKDGNFGLVKLRHSPAVAMMEDMKYKERTFHLDPGDTLFVYTDGVPEATNKDMEMFGEERLEIALNKYKDLEMGAVAGNQTQKSMNLSEMQISSMI